MSDAVLAAPRAPWRGWASFWIAPTALVLAILFFYPLSLIARQAFSDEAGDLTFTTLLQVIHAPYFINGVVNTIEIALASTAGCLIVGLTLALIFAFTPFPGSVFIARLIDTFIALPTFLATLAFTFIYGSAGILNGALVQTFHLAAPPVDFLYTAWGVVLAEVTVYTPFILRPLLASFSLIDRGQIEAASILGARPWRIVTQVIFPVAIPALIAGGSLCLLLTVNEFGIVLFIGAKGVITLPLLIYDKAIQESDYPAACVIAVINVALSLSLFALYRIAARRLGA
jgi:2-aminoethylphosphonate transport system permease protein